LARFVLLSSTKRVAAGRGNDREDRRCRDDDRGVDERDVPVTPPPVQSWPELPMPCGSRRAGFMAPACALRSLLDGPGDAAGDDESGRNVGLPGALRRGRLERHEGAKGPACRGRCLCQ
jgi:hypothetical protein